MRAVDAPIVLLTLAIAIGLPGCARNPVPQEWRRPAGAAQRSTVGGWIIIEAKSPRGRIAAGELIAIDERVFHVLTTAGLQSVPRASAQRIRLFAYGNRAGALAGWAVAGGISTLSHGGFLLFTAPMWVIGGIVATRAEKRGGMVRDDELARRFARFPQGLPPNFDPNTLGRLTGHAEP